MQASNYCKNQMILKMNNATIVFLLLLISNTISFKLVEFSKRTIHKSVLFLNDEQRSVEKDLFSAFKLIKVCRVCKKQYNVLESNENYCRYHKGRWLGAENSKHMGTRSGGKHVGLSLFWDCCDEECESGPGCCLGPHKSYDDI